MSKSGLRLFWKHRMVYFKKEHRIFDIESVIGREKWGFEKTSFTEHFAFVFKGKNKLKSLYISDDGFMHFD